MDIRYLRYSWLVLCAKSILQDLNQLHLAFQRLSAIDDPVKFVLKLEQQKQLWVCQGTFR